MKHLSFLFCLIGLCFCLSCADKSTNTKNVNCPTPPPEAIFKKDLSGISGHHFSIKGRDSEESLTFADSSAVTIFQSGCEKIAQEYRFTLPPSPDKSSVNLAVERLTYLTRLGPDYMTFGGWANAIASLEKEFASNSAVQVEPGFFVGLDKLDTKERTILIIKLFEQ